MSPLYNVAIQAHPSRAKFIRSLTDILGDVPVAWSEREGDVWDTWKRASALRVPDAEFMCVIQDDAIVTPMFHERMRKMIQDGGDAFLYCLFFRKKSRRTHSDMNTAADHAVAHDQDHFVFPRFQFNVGSVIPTKYLPELIEHGDGISSYGDDPRINSFATSRRLLTYYPLPSLVDHRDGVSVIGAERPRRRRAWQFAS